MSIQPDWSKIRRLFHPGEPEVFLEAMLSLEAHEWTPEAFRCSMMALQCALEAGRTDALRSVYKSKIGEALAAQKMWGKALSFASDKDTFEFLFSRPEVFLSEEQAGELLCSLVDRKLPACVSFFLATYPAVWRRSQAHHPHECRELDGKRRIGRGFKAALERVVNFKSKAGTTPMEGLLKLQDEDLIGRFLETRVVHFLSRPEPATGEPATNWEKLPLLFQAIQRGSLLTVRTYVRLGYGVGARFGGFSALHFAVHACQRRRNGLGDDNAVAIVRLLLEAREGVPCSPDPYGNTLLHYACADANLLVATLLVRAGEDLGALNDDGLAPTDYLETEEEVRALTLNAGRRDRA